MVARGLLALLTAATLAGCGASVRGLTEREASDVEGGRRVIVLLRLVTTSEEGEPVLLLNTIDFPSLALYGQFFVLVERVETGEQTKIRRPLVPSSEAEAAGWMYLLLPPGRYFLRTQTRLHGPVSGRYFLPVPSNRTLIYAGSLPMTCRGKSTAEVIFTKSGRTPHCGLPDAVTDERDEAARIAAVAFGPHALPATVLMTQR